MHRRRLHPTLARTAAWLVATLVSPRPSERWMARYHAYRAMEDLLP